MLEHENHELDVDFEIIEDPEDLVFPRLPNVISHRGHRVMIVATVHDVPHPERSTDITMLASIHVLDNALLNEKGHVCHPFQLWGTSEELKVTFPSEEYSKLPFKIEAVVSKDAGDDHLGQGPDYEAVVDIATSGGHGSLAHEDEEEEEEEEEEARETQPPDATVRSAPARTEGSYIIRFTTK